VLTYRELADPGWKASVRGRSTPVVRFQGVYQRISLPKGASSVEFSYAPPDDTIAWLAALLGVLAILAGLLRRRLFSKSDDEDAQPAALATARA
jgi:uncharacterized membrane protein YfhO